MSATLSHYALNVRTVVFVDLIHGVCSISYLVFNGTALVLLVDQTYYQNEAIAAASYC